MQKLHLQNPLTDDLPKHKGWAVVSRFGGIGDVIQATSIPPLLEAQGYKVAFVTEAERGAKLLSHDPHIHKLITIPKDSIKAGRLSDFHNRLHVAFDTAINLSGSIELALLLHPSQPEYTNTKYQRHERCNKNYQEKLHDIAGLPHNFSGQRFYPSALELKKARAKRNKLGLKNKVVLWSLSGSSRHKVYPWTDDVCKTLLRSGNIRVVFVGDYACKILEIGWEDVSHVRCRSGRWDIRDTLAFLPFADVVVGTETGVLNAAGMLDVPKVLLLSHSSRENLPKHWVNTTAIAPPQHLCSCHPCHMLHWSWNSCNRDEITGTAVCAATIDYKDVLKAISKWLKLPTCNYATISGGRLAQAIQR